MIRFCLLTLFICVCLVSRAQYYFYNSHYYDKDWITEFGVSVNAMNCITDLGGKTLDFKNFKLAGGVYAGFMYANAVGARIEVTYGSVTASDARAPMQTVRARNLSFKSYIHEIDVLGEFHPLNFRYHPDGLPALSPYLLAGIGYFSFNPQTKLSGNNILLQPLHTEGQGFAETGISNYNLSQINLPVGGGLQYALSGMVSIKGELVYRLLNTDYIDDVSAKYVNQDLFDAYLTPTDAALAKQLYWRTDDIYPENKTPKPGAHRGSSKKDAYYSVNIKLALTLGRARINRL